MMIAVKWNQPLEYVMEQKDMTPIWDFIEVHDPNFGKPTQEEVNEETERARKADLKLQEYARKHEQG
jgi:hypothetical protein